jgi:hypothetical protein
VGVENGEGDEKNGRKERKGEERRTCVRMRGMEKKENRKGEWVGHVLSLYQSLEISFLKYPSTNL